MGNRNHNYSISICSINVIDPARFVPVATACCTLDDWQNLTGCDEGMSTKPRIQIDLESDLDETHEAPIFLSIETARTLLPELVAHLVRKQLAGGTS